MNYVDAIAGVMPWAGSLIPATLTYEHARSNLGMEVAPALLIAGVVEGIGFVAITTALDLYELRQSERRVGVPGDTKSFWVTVIAGVVYLGVVILINAILGSGSVTEKITLGLLSTFGVLGGLLVALRKHLSERLAALLKVQSGNREQAAQAQARQEEIEREEREFARKLEEERLRQEHELRMAHQQAEDLRKLERERAKALRNVAGKSPDGAEGGRTVSGGGAEGVEQRPGGVRRWADVPPDDYGWIAEAPVGEIVKRYGIGGKDPERMARTWKGYARDGLKKREAAHE